MNKSKNSNNSKTPRLESKVRSSTQWYVVVEAADLHSHHRRDMDRDQAEERYFGDEGEV